MSNITLPEKVYKWGQAILVTGAILTGSVAIAKKTVATVQAGPEAIQKADALDKRVTRLEKQSRFVVRGIEKLTGTRYRREAEEAGD
jgi:hypothetical protein